MSALGQKRSFASLTSEPSSPLIRPPASLHFRNSGANSEKAGSTDPETRLVRVRVLLPQPSIRATPPHFQFHKIDARFPRLTGVASRLEFDKLPICIALWRLPGSPSQDAIFEFPNLAKDLSGDRFVYDRDW